MDSHHSFSEVRKMLEKSISDPKKREYILGYLEGQAERSGSDWKISSPRLEEALRRLGSSRESSAPSYRQVNTADVEKIRGHFQNRPTR
ncbi:MAG: hypothetical protein AAB650_00105 [Patescibacteria group bacterium]